MPLVLDPRYDPLVLLVQHFHKQRKAFFLVFETHVLLETEDPNCIARFILTIHWLTNKRWARRHAREEGLELLVVGKGSNLLFDDRGFNGLVVVNRICFVKVRCASSRESVYL